MKRLVILALAALTATGARASLLVNGSFEQPPTGAWGYFVNGEVPGWTVGKGQVMEIGRYMAYGLAQCDGLNVMETDSDRNVTFEQSVNLVGGQYDLSFEFARRKANMLYKPDDTCDFDVLWNGQVVASLSPSVSDWTSEHVTVSGNDGANQVAFRAMGTSDGYGSLIDDARLNAVPEPASLLALGVGVAGLVRARRKVRA